MAPPSPGTCGTAAATAAESGNKMETRTRLMAPEFMCDNLNITRDEFHTRLVNYFGNSGRMGPLTDSDLFRFVRFLHANVVLDEDTKNSVGVAAVDYPWKTDDVDGDVLPPESEEEEDDGCPRRPKCLLGPDGYDLHLFWYYKKTLKSIKKKIGIGEKGSRTVWIFILKTVRNQERRICRWDLPLDLELLGKTGWCTSRGLFEAEESLEREEELWLLIRDFLKGREDILRPALNDFAYGYGLKIPCFFTHHLTQEKKGVVKIVATEVFSSKVPEYQHVPKSVWLKRFCQHLVGFCVPKINEVFGVVQLGRILWVDQEKDGAIVPKGSLFEQVREACLKVERSLKKKFNSKNDTDTTGKQPQEQEEFRYSMEEHGCKVLGIHPHTQEPVRIEVIGEIPNRHRQTFSVQFTDYCYPAKLPASNIICSQDIELFPEFLRLLPPQGYPVVTRVFTLQTEEEWTTHFHKSFGPTGIPITFSVDSPAKEGNPALIDLKVDIDKMEKSQIHEFFGNIFQGIAAPEPKPFNALEFYLQNKMKDGEVGGIVV